MPVFLKFCFCLNSILKLKRLFFKFKILNFVLNKNFFFLKKADSFFLSSMLFLKKKFFSIKVSIFKNVFFTFDSIFFSLICNKFINNIMVKGRKSKADFLFYNIFFFLKLITNLRPNIIILSSLFSSKIMLTCINKFISGKKNLVPSFFFFDKQVKTVVSFFSKHIKKKKDSFSVSSEHTQRSKRFIFLAELFLRVQRLYFSKISRFTQRKNVFFSLLKKNYYLYVKQRSFVQFRWR